jgi:type II secretory pathway pseudopilin PulG
VVKKYTALFLFIFVTSFVNAQVINQTFVDRCTGEVKVVSANFNNGPTAVTFYNKVRVFTPQEAVNGTLQQWLIQTYAAWNALSPCSQTAQQTQQAQQTAQQATQSAQQATSNLPPPPTSSTTSNNGTTTNNTTSSSSNSSESKTGSEGTETSNSSSGSESENTGAESSDGGSETSDGESSEGEDEDTKSEKKDEKKKQQRMNPILVSGDVIAMQSLTGRYNSVLSFGVSQSSLFGDVSYSANTMIWDNLQQIMIGGSVTKSHLNDDYTLNYVDSYSINYGRMYKSNSVSISNSTIKPTNIGTFGFGINFSAMWGSDMNGTLISYGWNVLYTRPFPINTHWTYSPALIIAKNPGTYSSIDNLFITNKDAIGILSNGFDLQISKRFRINLNYTLIGNTNSDWPFLHNIMVGSKLQF